MGKECAGLESSWCQTRVILDETREVDVGSEGKNFLQEDMWTLSYRIQQSHESDV